MIYVRQEYRSLRNRIGYLTLYEYYFMRHINPCVLSDFSWIFFQKIEYLLDRNFKLLCQRAGGIASKCKIMN